MSLREAIEQVLRHATPAPPNEAATLFRVIDPLLLAMGYSPLEIEPESSVSQWQRPDRTILPGTEHEWCLEAKAWGVSLDDEKHLQQATNYAHSRGRRWVVLTNGQVWRIYDDHITGLPPADRLVAEARLDQSADMEQLLRAVSKSAVLSGGLGHFALRSRISAILTRSLKDEGSEAIRALGCGASPARNVRRSPPGRRRLLSGLTGRRSAGTPRHPFGRFSPPSSGSAYAPRAS